jgi:hypothetical protein
VDRFPKRSGRLGAQVLHQHRTGKADSFFRCERRSKAAAGCYPTDVIRRPAVLIAVCAEAIFGGCRSAQNTKPDLPQSVSPEWTLKSLERQPAPSGIPKDGQPECWRAEYAGNGKVHAYTCRYDADTGAFDAVQRTRTEAQTVKFQEGPYLVIVNWENVSEDDLTPLVRALQKSLGPPKSAPSK